MQLPVWLWPDVTDARVRAVLQQNAVLTAVVATSAALAALASAQALVGDPPSYWVAAPWAWAGPTRCTGTAPGFLSRPHPHRFAAEAEHSCRFSTVQRV